MKDRFLNNADLLENQSGTSMHSNTKLFTTLKLVFCLPQIMNTIYVPGPQLNTRD